MVTSSSPVDNLLLTKANKKIAHHRLSDKLKSKTEMLTSFTDLVHQQSLHLASLKAPPHCAMGSGHLTSSSSTSTLQHSGSRGLRQKKNYRSCHLDLFLQPSKPLWCSDQRENEGGSGVTTASGPLPARGAPTSGASVPSNQWCRIGSSIFLQSVLHLCSS